MEAIGYLVISLYVANHLARKANTDDWVQFIPIALAWPFYPLAWVLGKFIRQ